jgi:hypothetical protein
MGRDKERRVPTSRLKEHLALPARLRALDGHLASSRRGVFADWELERAAPLTKLFPDDEADIVEVVAPRFTVFAGDFAGGLLALDHEGARDVERAAVVCFDSEGGFDVVGTSFDDFLALIASEEADPREDCWQAAEALRRFIVSTGIEPHASAGRRLTELGPATRAFRAGFARALGEASLRVRPDENIVHELVPGERIGEVALGMSRAGLDARWGRPSIPDWGRDETRVVALYASMPVVVELDAQRDEVAKISLYEGRHRAVSADGTELMFMTAAEATAWLEAAGHGVTRRNRELRAGGLRLTLAASRGGEGVEPWVEAIELTRAR